MRGVLVCKVASRKRIYLQGRDTCQCTVVNRLRLVGGIDPGIDLHRHRHRIAPRKQPVFAWGSDVTFSSVAGCSPYSLGIELNEVGGQSACAGVGLTSCRPERA